MSWVDVPLPLSLPAARPVSIEDRVRSRDGECCRLCGSQTQPAPPLVNVRPGYQGPSVDPELYCAVVCLGCEQRVKWARDARERTPGDLAWEDRMVLRGLERIYMENLMDPAFLREVSR